MNKARFPNSRSEDAQLLMAFISDRDEIAFGRLVRKYEKLVWIVCYRVLNNHCDAEDAFQATFALLASKARRIRKPKSIASWLYGVAFRSASSIRRQRHREHVPYQELADPGLPEDILEQVSRKNDIELVSAELMGLAEKYKTPLVMFYLLGNSTTQIANTLGLSVVAIESRLKRGRLALKSRLLGRGLESKMCQAGILAVPSIAINQTLISKTIASGLAAGIGSGWLQLLFGHSHSIKQSGVKLMIMKTGVAFGLVMLLGLGVAMHSGGFAKQPVQQTIARVQPDSDPPQAAVNLVQEQDKAKKKKNEERHIDKVHQHLHRLFQHLHGALHGGHDSQKDDQHQKHRLHLHELHKSHSGGQHSGGQHSGGQHSGG